MAAKKFEVSMTVKDVVTHDKDGTMSVPMFGRIMGSDEKTPAMTFNLNINNITADGKKLLDTIGGTKGIRTGNGYTLVLVFTGEDSTLDDYNDDDGDNAENPGDI